MFPPNQGGGQGPFGGAPQGAGQQGPFGAPMPTGGAFGAPQSAGGYEFNPQENQVIAGLASMTKFNGIAQLVGLGLGLVQAALLSIRAVQLGSGAIGTMFGSVIGALIGVMFSLVVAGAMFKSSAAFQRVVDTQGSDVPNLMEALAHQRSFFGLLKILVVVAFAFIALACVAGIVIGGLFAAPHSF